MNIKLEKYRKATSEEIKVVETALGISLPQDYRSFVEQYDGAEPEDNIFREDGQLSITRFISVSEIPKNVLRIEGLPRGSLPIAEMPSGDYLIMDSGNNQISYWDHEEYPPYDLIAASFTKFLQLMKPCNWTDVALKPGQDLGGWVDPNFKPEF